jgi:hypothetical protein
VRVSDEAGNRRLLHRESSRRRPGARTPTETRHPSRPGAGTGPAHPPRSGPSRLAARRRRRTIWPNPRVEGSVDCAQIDTPNDVARPARSAQLGALYGSRRAQCPVARDSCASLTHRSARELNSIWIRQKVHSIAVVGQRGPTKHVAYGLHVARVRRVDHQGLHPPRIPSGERLNCSRLVLQAPQGDALLRNLQLPRDSRSRRRNTTSRTRRQG